MIALRGAKLMNTEQPMPILDDLTRVGIIDRRQMLRLIRELPEQMETAQGIGQSFVCEPLPEAPNVIVVSGVGENAVAADMAAAIIEEETAVPVISRHGGKLPRSVDERSLVFIVDYSGKNEFAVAQYKDARQRGAAVICLASGGPLMAAVAADGLKAIKVPPGQPARTAIGYMLIPLFVVAEKCGVVSGLVEKLSHGIRLLKNSREALRIDNPTTRNVAKQIADQLQDKIAVIYGAPDYRNAVGERWKNQLNLNSKAPAFSGIVPDAALSVPALWSPQEEPKFENVAVIMLRDTDDRSSIGKIMTAMAESMKDVTIIDVDLKGATSVEKLLYGLYLGDYVSCYLAFLRDIDPSLAENVAEIEAIMHVEMPVEKPVVTEPVENVESEEA